MIEYGIHYYDKLAEALAEHIGIVLMAMMISLAVAAVFTVLCSLSRTFSRLLLSAFSVIYSIPSLAMLALFIPITGLGTTTAIVVLVIYNQYLMLRNFVSGLEAVDHNVTEAAVGMGMTPMQVLTMVRLPLARKSLIAGIRISLISTTGIAAIAASVNAGGLGVLLFDGLRTMNVDKILWGSVLSAALALIFDGILLTVEKRFT